MKYNKLKCTGRLSDMHIVSEQTGQSFRIWPDNWNDLDIQLQALTFTLLGGVKWSVEKWTNSPS